MKKIIIPMIALSALSTNVFAQTEEIQPISLVTENLQPIGGTTDEKGCISSAGYIFDETLEKCVRTFEPDFLHEWALKTQITTAKNVEEFAPTKNISREEVAVLVERIVDAKLISGAYPTNEKVTFADNSEISPEFTKAVEFVQNHGIMKGNNDKFFPKNNLTTYEALVILSRATLSGEVYNHNDAMKFAKEDLGITLDEKTLDEAITRKDFFHFAYIASKYEKKIIEENAKNGAVRGTAGICQVGVDSTCNGESAK